MADLGGRADVEFESDVGSAFFDDDSDGSGVNRFEVEGCDGARGSIIEGEILNADELFAVH